MQKRNREGFTLIELLAVIVILAIIALIAVPVIMNVITKARISAFEDSAYGIVKAGEMYYTNALLDAEGMTEDQEFTVVNDIFKNTTSDETLDLSGSIPSSGKVTVTSEGKVAIAISNGEYCIRKATTESKVETKKLSDLEDGCDYKKIASSIFTIAANGTEIPACIADNTTCSTDDIKNGIKVGVKVNDSETKNFYVIKDENNKLTLIMDGNIDNTTVAWSNSSNSEGPVVALTYLESKTSSWTNISSETYTLSDTYNSEPKYTGITRTSRARLLTMTEANTLGCTSTQYSCPAWLYENGANYWTSSASAGTSDGAWFVNGTGDTLDADVSVDSDYHYGVRPVIIISKTML